MTRTLRFFLTFLWFSPSSSSCFSIRLRYLCFLPFPLVLFSFAFPYSSSFFLLSVRRHFLTIFYTSHSRVPGSSTNFTSSPLPPIPATAPNPESSPHSWLTPAGDAGQLSSDEADAETPEDTERPAFHCTNHHPQPVGVNTANAVLTDILIVKKSYKHSC